MRGWGVGVGGDPWDPYSCPSKYWTLFIKDKWVHCVVTLKPIFQQKLCSCWQPNENEIDTNNMKSTWPTRNSPIQTIFHQVALGLVLGSRGFALGLRAFLDTNIATGHCQLANRSGRTHMEGWTVIFVSEHL